MRCCCLRGVGGLGKLQGDIQLRAVSEIRPGIWLCYQHGAKSDNTPTPPHREIVTRKGLSGQANILLSLLT